MSTAPGCHAHLGRLPVLGLNLGGVGRASLQLERGGDAGEEEEGKWGSVSPSPAPRRHLWLYNWLAQRFLSSYLILGERRGEGSSVGQEAAGEGQGEDRVSNRKEKLIKKGYSEESEPGQWSAKNQPAANLP